MNPKNDRGKNRPFSTELLPLEERGHFSLTEAGLLHCRNAKTVSVNFACEYHETCT